VAEVLACGEGEGVRWVQLRMPYRHLTLIRQGGGWVAPDGGLPLELHPDPAEVVPLRKGRPPPEVPQSAGEIIRSARVSREAAGPEGRPIRLRPVHGGKAVEALVTHQEDGWFIAVAADGRPELFLELDGGRCRRPHSLTIYETGGRRSGQGP